MTVVDEIRARRELLGMTQQQAAARAGVPEREWRAIEVGESDASAAMLGGCRRPEHEWSTGCL